MRYELCRPAWATRRVAAQESNRLIDLSSHEAEPEADDEEEGGEGAAKEPAAGGVSS